MDIQQVSLWIGVYAAVISTGLLVLRVLSYRAESGARLKITTTWLPGSSSHDPALRIGVVNNGRTPATVRSINLDLPGPILVPIRHFAIEGPRLPIRVEAADAVIWTLDGNDLKAHLRENGWPMQARAVVTAGNGKRVWESVHARTAIT